MLLAVCTFVHNLKRNKMDQFFEHHEKWECLKYGMYSSKKPKDEMVLKSAKLLSDQVLFGDALNKLKLSWPVSLKVHLTNSGINRKAYLGRAACCVELGVNELTVQIAWRTLDTETQKEANKTAQNFIKQYAENLS